MDYLFILAELSADTSLLLLFLFWFIPISMFLVGLSWLAEKPKKAKRLLIISCVWLLIGVGICRSMIPLY